MQDRRMILKILPQTTYNRLFHDGLHFCRDTRHRHQYLAISFKPHDRSRPHGILNNCTHIRNIGLIARTVIHRQFTTTKNGFHIGKYRFVEDQLSTEIITKSLLCNIVLRRAQSTGHQNDIDPTERAIQSIGYFPRPISNCRYLGNFPPYMIQLPSNPPRIRIGHLSDQQLIADNNNLDIHFIRIYNSTRAKGAFAISQNSLSKYL